MTTLTSGSMTLGPKRLRRVGTRTGAEMAPITTPTMPPETEPAMPPTTAPMIRVLTKSATRALNAGGGRTPTWHHYLRSLMSIGK